MGCCGCSNKSSAVTAGIFGLVQSLAFLILYIVFLSIYWGGNDIPTSWQELVKTVMDERTFLLYATYDAISPLRIILLIVAISHSIWLISSMTLLIGACNDNVCCIRQWVVITSFIIIGDFIVPVVVILMTFNSFQDAIQLGGNYIQSATNTDDSVQSQVGKFASGVGLDMYKYYFLLVFSVCKGGLITLIINICLCVFTNKRAKELTNQPGYVLMPVPMLVTQLTQQPSAFSVAQQMHISPSTYPLQQYPPSAQDDGFVNPQFNNPLASFPGTYPQESHTVPGQDFEKGDEFRSPRV